METSNLIMRRPARPAVWDVSITVRLRLFLAVLILCPAGLFVTIGVMVYATHWSDLGDVSQPRAPPLRVPSPNCAKPVSLVQTTSHPWSRIIKQSGARSYHDGLRRRAPW
jgi:hypothetical protein